MPSYSESKLASQPIPKKSQQIKTDKPRPHVCTICTRAFARLEHLKRHERAHTNEKPFQCGSCGRCFARRDLVLRHQQKLHTNAQGGIRRASEVNDQIIVLANNTNPNAPLPKDDSTPNSTPTQIFSPSKDFNKMFDNDEDQDHLSQMSSNSTPNKDDETSVQSNHTVQTSYSQPALPSQPTFPIQQHSIVKNLKQQDQFNTRHQSFSAASGNSYVKENMTPSFTTPQFSHDDLNTSKELLSGGIGLDLGYQYEYHDSLNLNQKKLSMKNLQQYFVESVTNNNNVNYNNVLASFQFNNPNHPHHIEGTTPMDYEMEASLDLNMLKMFEKNNQNNNDIKQEFGNDSKRFKHNNPDEWLHELIDTPYENMIGTPSSLFVPELKSQSDHSIDDINNLFKGRQDDLLKQIDSSNDSKSFISFELHSKILSISNLSGNQFPAIDELNKYLKLYENEFDKYFPFIHLPSLKNSESNDNIPLLLSMASIGALYGFNQSHSLLLFNLSKYHIQHFFEKEITMDNLQFKKVPHMAHQCLVLHIFISMFLNEPNMIEITQRQVKSMIGLIKSTNFNEPLENFLIPPSSFENIQSNFDYFIVAQSRIRTLHVFYLLQIIRSSFVNVPIFFDHTDLRSGNACANEGLWKSENSHQWFERLSGTNKSIIEISNGQSTSDLVKYLTNQNLGDHDHYSMENMFSLLIYLNEKVALELDILGDDYNYMNWNLHHKPQLMESLQAWEQKFISNGGTLTIDHNNKYVLNVKHNLKLILPLHSLCKIRIEFNITSFTNPILFKQWANMNDALDKIIGNEPNQENLKNCLGPCINVIKLWILNIESINYDIQQTSLRTPIFFTLCILVAIIIISLYVQYLEQKSTPLTDSDLLKWFECESILLKVDRILTPILKSSYSEILTNQSDGVFNSITKDHNVIKISALFQQKEQVLHDQQAISKLNQEINGEIRNVKLSTKSLYLGIRILADAPIWPVATGFAEALKKRAVYLSGNENSIGNPR